MGRGYSSEQWSAWIEEQRGSGRSIAAFCDWIGVSQNSFYLWRRKLEASGTHYAGRADSGKAPHSGTRATSSTGARINSVPSVLRNFVPLSVTTSQIIEVDLPCGATLRVPNDESSLRRVLSVLLDSGDSRA